MKFSEVFIYGDQPMTCPECGNRTEIKFESIDYKNTQYHKCLTDLCGFEFVSENDIE